MRRDGLLTLLLALALLATVPGYDRVFTDTSWRGGAVGAGLAALVVTALARRLHLPTWLAVPVATVTTVLALPWLLDLHLGWRDDAGAQLRLLRTTFADGLVLLAEEPSPAEPVAGLVLLAAVGYAVVALLAHEVLVRSGHAAPPLVMLTALWTVPLAIPTAGQDGWLLVVPYLVAAGVLLLAAVNLPRAAPMAIPLPASGLALGAAAIAVAMTSPWLLPSHGADAWLQLSSGAQPRGYQPIVDITNRLGSPEEREVLRVRASQRSYLRLAGLDSFDGATWRLGPGDDATFRPDPAALFPADAPLPPEEPAASTELVEVDVEVLQLENIYVPLPYQPVEVLGPIRDQMVWSTEGGFLATWDRAEAVGETVGIREGSAYRVLAERPTPTFEELAAVDVPAQVLAAHTALPRDYPELGAQAEEVYAAAEATTVVERALALQSWFVGSEGGFTYDLDVPALRGEDALTTFVLEDRVGYCEYFATAMAVMLRQTGIPARVAVGFLPGERVGAADPTDGTGLDEYLITTGDAHAWVEVLFPGYGWITFEPTPRSDDTHILPRPEDLAPVENEAERAERAADEDPEDLEAPEAAAEVPDLPEQELPDDVDGAAGGALDEAGAAGAARTRWVALALLLAPVVVVLLARLGQRGVAGRARGDDPRGAVLAAQRRLYAAAHRVGLERQPHETAREVIARWEAEGRVDRDRGDVAGAVQAAAFDGHLAPERAATAVASLDRMSAQLTDRVPKRELLLTPLRRLRGRLTRERSGVVRRWRER